MVALSCSSSITHSSIKPPFHSSVVTITPIPCNCTSINFTQMITHPIIIEKTSRFPAIRGKFYPKFCAINPHQTSSTTHLGNWEDPVSSDSETDEEDDIEENNLDFESDWEEEKDASETQINIESLSTSQIEEDLKKEVEQLLSPEERAILQQNESPNLDKISTEKWNPLHTLALSGQIKFMDNLLENGFEIDAADKEGQTALHKAVLGKKEAVISHLLRKGASPHAQDLSGATPLHYAVQVSAMQTVKLLIKCKADVNVADNEGWTPLHVAMQSRNRDIAKVLLVNGADKTRRTENGKTPLDLGLCYGKEFKAYDLAKLLKLVPANNYH
ncbi:ankyrin repeat domain-containing protein EMB506, chloroplastic [Lactuca sativa]|uniref:ankyrin repeat domain-containing protein EMB506, chloroplastic n=1 Tax=Lactuca sativa TaxID=4236 RepID=UPI000CB8CB9B|nr:ankyrin repeat domain-containing protein EMB506, chloroplastic [Lactuca sativa]